MKKPLQSVIWKKLTVKGTNKSSRFSHITINSPHPKIGFSPDAIGRCLCWGIRPIKVKCLFSSKQVPTPQDVDTNTPDAIALIVYLIS